VAIDPPTMRANQAQLARLLGLDISSGVLSGVSGS
jgi:hypothetical protein